MIILFGSNFPSLPHQMHNISLRRWIPNVPWGVAFQFGLNHSFLFLMFTSGYWLLFGISQQRCINVDMQIFVEFLKFAHGIHSQSIKLGNSWFGWRCLSKSHDHPEHGETFTSIDWFLWRKGSYNYMQPTRIKITIRINTSLSNTKIDMK